MRALLGAAMLILASCAITPEPAKLPELDGVPSSFEMSGRLAVRQGDRSDIAKLRWTHERARDTWVISSPLGNEIARIESGERGATLRRGGGDAETAPDFRSLTEQLLGVALDPASQRDWLLLLALLAGCSIAFGYARRSWRQAAGATAWPEERHD